jgi:DHA1 family multidrug resistance protein-like MFS transporter
MPIVFYLFGKRIRSRSNFAPAPDIQQDKRRDEESKGGNMGDEAGSGSTERGDDSELRKERSKEE